MSDEIASTNKVYQIDIFPMKLIITQCLCVCTFLAENQSRAMACEVGVDNLSKLK